MAMQVGLKIWRYDSKTGDRALLARLLVDPEPPVRVAAIAAVADLGGETAPLLAALGALGRLSSNAVVNAIASFYVSFFRGTPLILQLRMI